MGKAAKQNANRLAKQIKSNKDNEDFQNMIASMKEDKTYQIKKGNGYLFNGANLKGSVWKKIFLKPEPQKNDTTGN